jgi:hypothetical protein
MVLQMTKLHPTMSQRMDPKTIPVGLFLAISFFFGLGFITAMGWLSSKLEARVNGS